MQADWPSAGAWPQSENTHWPQGELHIPEEPWEQPWDITWAAANSSGSLAGWPQQSPPALTAFEFPWMLRQCGLSPPEQAEAVCSHRQQRMKERAQGCPHNASPAHTSNQAPAEPDICSHSLLMSSRREETTYRDSCNFTWERCCPKWGAKFQERKMSFSSLKTLMPECSFPGKFYLAAPLWLLYKQRNQLQVLVEYV